MNGIGHTAKTPFSNFYVSYCKDDPSCKGYGRELLLEAVPDAKDEILSLPDEQCADLWFYWIAEPFIREPLKIREKFVDYIAESFSQLPRPSDVIQASLQEVAKAEEIEKHQILTSEKIQEIAYKMLRHLILKFYSPCFEYNQMHSDLCKKLNLQSDSKIVTKIIEPYREDFSRLFFEVADINGLYLRLLFIFTDLKINIKSLDYEELKQRLVNDKLF